MSLTRPCQCVGGGGGKAEGLVVEQITQPQQARVLTRLLATRLHSGGTPVTSAADPYPTRLEIGGAVGHTWGTSTREWHSNPGPCCMLS